MTIFKRSIYSYHKNASDDYVLCKTSCFSSRSSYLCSLKTGITMDILADKQKVTKICVLKQTYMLHESIKYQIHTYIGNKESDCVNN